MAVSVCIVLRTLQTRAHHARMHDALHDARTHAPSQTGCCARPLLRSLRDFPLRVRGYHDVSVP